MPEEVIEQQEQESADDKQQGQTQELGQETVSRAELEAVLRKNAELLSEKKKVAERARELEESSKRAEEDRLKQNEQFKELYEKSEAEKNRISEEFETHRQTVQRKELESKSYKLASELTRDTSRAELLSEKVASFAKNTDGGWVYEVGGIEIDADKLKTHLKEKYPFLVDGSGASGGGAVGSQNPGGVKSSNAAAQEAKNKGDLNGFLTAHMKN